MAANFWDSTQAKHWMFTKPELDEMRKELDRASQAIINKYALPERRLMNIYFQQQLIKLGRRMNLRQQALATAQVYIRRFYTKVEIRKTNPYLIMATAVYLACKMEECPQHIRLMLGEAARQWPELGVTESSKIGECEFALISTLSSRLILHHPYRALSELQSGQTSFTLTQDENSLAHSIINDSYNTDLPLLYPPHVIAITAIFLAVVLRPAQSGLQAHSAATSAGAVQSAMQGLGSLQGKSGQAKVQKLTDWLADSKVDMEAMVDCCQELISLYDLWDSYNERACKDGITKFMKDPGLNK